MHPVARTGARYSIGKEGNKGTYCGTELGYFCTSGQGMLATEMGTVHSELPQSSWNIMLTLTTDNGFLFFFGAH